MPQTKKEEVDMIVKFVRTLYSPVDVWVNKFTDERYAIHFYFSEIPDKFIQNPQYRDLEEHKASMLNREIRTYLKDWFGIRTAGNQPPHFFPPSVDYPIRTYVEYRK